MQHYFYYYNIYFIIIKYIKFFVSQRNENIIRIYLITYEYNSSENIYYNR
jgi:hypothetical protein